MKYNRISLLVTKKVIGRKLIFTTRLALPFYGYSLALLETETIHTPGWIAVKKEEMFSPEGKRKTVEDASYLVPMTSRLGPKKHKSTFILTQILGYVLNLARNSTSHTST